MTIDGHAPQETLIRPRHRWPGSPYCAVTNGTRPSVRMVSIRPRHRWPGGNEERRQRRSFVRPVGRVSIRPRHRCRGKRCLATAKQAQSGCKPNPPLDDDGQGETSASGTRGSTPSQLFQSAPIHRWPGETRSAESQCPWSTGSAQSAPDIAAGGNWRLVGGRRGARPSSGFLFQSAPDIDGQGETLNGSPTPRPPHLVSNPPRHRWPGETANRPLRPASCALPLYVSQSAPTSMAVETGVEAAAACSACDGEVSIRPRHRWPGGNAIS